LKKIENPFIGREEYNCFGCSPENPCGMKMEFFEDGENIISLWKPHINFAGYKNILHGGIHSALMDEIAGWFVSYKLKKQGVTCNLEVRYKKPAKVDEGDLKLVAAYKKTERNIVSIKVELFDPAGELCSSGIVKYFLFE
jgi:uncharacterized protein (TIGR00369 family)